MREGESAQTHPKQNMHVFILNTWSVILTSGVSLMCLAHCLMSLMASMDISGKLSLQANSARHMMPSWNESMIKWK